MTLQNGMIWRGEVRLYSDTAFLELPSAKICAFASKGFNGVAAPYAVATTLIEEPDRAQGVVPLAEALARYGPTGLKCSGDVLDVCENWLARASRDQVKVGRLLIGCNYPETGPELLLIATDNLGFARPLEAVQLASFVSSANDSPECLEAMEKGFDKARMLAVIDAQRRTQFDSPGHGLVYGIGGAAIEIRVRPRGAALSVVRQWADRVGEVIRP